MTPCHFGARMILIGRGDAMAYLLPSDAVLEGWTSLNDAMQWAAVPTNLMRSVARQLGNPDMTQLTLFAAVLPEEWRDALTQARIGSRELTSFEKGQMRLLANAVRKKFGLSFAFEGVASVAQQPLAASTVPTSAAPATTPRVKLKLSQVVDQGADQDCEMLSSVELLACRQRYIASTGDSPLEKEEVTDAQLSCLRAKVESGQAPFIDMGVWGPYGDRIARAMKFTSQALKDGQWKAVELPGAANILAWEESWRIFRTACIMLDIAKPAVLDRYSAEFRNRVAEYPDVWHLAAQADIRCRSEWWQQEQRRQHSFHLAHPTLEPCPFHVCEWCRQLHRSIQCPQVPGWNPEEKSLSTLRGRGGGKGKGGRGRSQRRQ